MGPTAKKQEVKRAWVYKSISFKIRHTTNKYRSREPEDSQKDLLIVQMYIKNSKHMLACTPHFLQSITLVQ